MEKIRVKIVEFYQELILKIGIRSKILTIFLGLFLGIMAMPLIFSIKGCESLGFDENTGVIGDTIGGITSPFINFLGAILVYLALKAQIEANNEIRNQFNAQNEARREDEIFKNVQSALKGLDSDFKDFEIRQGKNPISLDKFLRLKIFTEVKDYDQLFNQIYFEEDIFKDERVYSNFKVLIKHLNSICLYFDNNVFEIHKRELFKMECERLLLNHLQFKNEYLDYYRDFEKVKLIEIDRDIFKDFFEFHSFVFYYKINKESSSFERPSKPEFFKILERINENIG